MTDKPIRIVRGRHDRDNKYFACARATAQDRELSWEARGILWYLLSKSDTWELRPKDLQQGCGRDKVYKILAELQDKQYIVREEHRDGNGKFVEFIYNVYETPFPENAEVVAAPFPDLPETALPDTVNTDNRELESKTELEKKTSAPPMLREVPTPSKRQPNPMYDAIQKVWRYTASLNANMAKMLHGVATEKGWKEYNLEKPITADELLEWGAWYRKTELHGDANLNMVENRAKIQSSIGYWQERRDASEKRARERAEADRQWEAQHPELYPEKPMEVAS